MGGSRIRQFERLSSLPGALGAVVVIAGYGLAQSRPAANDAIDAEVDAVLKQMGACLATARQLGFSAAEAMDQVFTDGQRVQGGTAQPHLSACGYLIR